MAVCLHAIGEGMGAGKPHRASSLAAEIAAANRERSRGAMPLAEWLPKERKAAVAAVSVIMRQSTEAQRYASVDDITTCLS